MLLLSLALLETAQPVEPTPKTVDFVCDVCQIIVQGCEDYIADQSNIQAVKEFLNQVCSILPFDLFGWCEKIIDQYYDQLVDYITQGYPADVVCQMIGLCD